MATKTVSLNKNGISKLPNDKSVLYNIMTPGGRINYTGIAKRGRVQERITEHLSGAKDPIPGCTVRIEQHSSIEAARNKEIRVIARNKPRYNKQGKE